jgi:hypothetical protein
MSFSHSTYIQNKILIFKKNLFQTQKMDSNPWLVESIEVFNFFCCPECVYRSQEEFSFQVHALQNHPQSQALFHGFCQKPPTDENRNPEGEWQNLGLRFL